MMMRAAMGILVVAVVGGLVATEKKMSDFASTTIDIGMVVRDIEKSVKFYKDAVGFKEVEGFDVPASLGRDSGLSDNKPFHVRVLVLGDGETATKLKLIQFADSPGKKVDNSFIHSSYGMRYLTIFVTDAGAAVERAKKAGAAPVAKGPTELPADIGKGIWLAVLRDPDGNMVELVGPKK
jgi:catechol 2,3-dioxygenase-like lactoylglutathione lyase family enzyme